MGRWCSVRCDCVRCLWQHIARVEMRERWRARSGAAGALGWAGSGRAKRAGLGSGSCFNALELEGDRWCPKGRVSCCL